MARSIETILQDRTFALRQLEDEFEGIHRSIVRITEVCEAQGIDAGNARSAWEILAEVRRHTRKAKSLYKAQMAPEVRKGN